MEQFDEPLTIEEKRNRSNNFLVTPQTMMGGRMTYAEWMARGNEISARARDRVRGLPGAVYYPDSATSTATQENIVDTEVTEEITLLVQESAEAVGQLAASRVLEPVSN